MTHTSLRFPKPTWAPFHNAGGAASTETIGGVIHYKATSQIGAIVAPGRYSQVRKVRFFVVFRNTIATALVNARLRVWATGASGVNTNPDKITLTPGSTSVTFPFASSIVNRCYAKFGTASSNNIASTSSGASHLLEIEFDRFDGQSDDFFQAWDSATGEQYLEFHPAIAANAGGPSSTSLNYFTFGCVVVQAPSAVNNSTTIVQIWRPGQGANGLSGGTGQTAFDNAQSPSRQQVRGAFRWRYNANDWDGIVGVKLVVLGEKRDVIGNTTFHVDRVTSNTPGAGATTNILTQTLVIGTSGPLFWWRSLDLLSQLVDGTDLCFDYRNDTGNGEVTAFLEIVQQNHTKTVTYHHANPTGTSACGVPCNGLTSGSTPQIHQGAFLFDPLWYSNYPASMLTKQHIVGQLNHRNVALAPFYEYLINSNLTEDQNGPTGVTATTVVVSPTINATPTGTQEWKYQDLPITANDPINLAGPRKCFIRLTGTWISASDPDSPGSMALMYAYLVPNTEVLVLGPLFPLDPFNQEGCASTAAGGGDPGVLAITNGSTPPKKFDPVSGLVQDLGIPEPFLGETPPAPLIESIAASPSTGLGIGLYAYRYTFRNCCTGKESNPSQEDIIVDTTGASPAAKVTFSFAGVVIPGDPQICEICLYRTVLGGAFPVMAKVGCFNISLTTIFVDTLSDLALDFTNEPLSQLNGVPPCCFAIVDFKNRLWLAGDIPSLSPVGTVSAVTGSDIITGSNEVEWDRCLEGKYIQLEGDCRQYEILHILPPPVGTSPPINRLQLTEEYEGASRTGALYHICGRPNRLYFSEPVEPEYWPEINFIDVEPGDGDRLTGLGSNFNQLVVCKRSKTYSVAFAENPVTEGTEARRISSDIGCIAPRSFAQVENGTVWLAERGLALFDGRGVEHVPESVEMNRIFIDPDHPDYVRRDQNGRVIGAVGAYYARREQYLLLLPSKRTTRGADMMLVWNVKLRNITLLQFCQEFASMVVAKDTDGNDRVYLGDTNGFVWIYDVGFTDGVGSPGSTGTVRGTVDASGVDPDTGASFIDDNSASFIEGGLPGLAGLSGIAGLSGAFSGAAGGNLGIAGVCVLLRAPGSAFDDPWISRTVYAATATRLYVTPGVSTLGDLTGYDYMLGPILFDAKTKPSNYGSDDAAKRHWRHALMFVPQAEASQVRVEVLTDNAELDELATEVASGDPPVVGAGRSFDMSQPKGRQVGTMPRLIHQLASVRFFNHAPEEPIEILNHALMFEPQQGR